MIEILQMIPEDEHCLVRLGCTCGDPSLAAYDCEDDQIIFCTRCGEITSRARLRNSSTLSSGPHQWTWLNVSSRAECPMINASLPVLVSFDPEKDGERGGLPALITKISTEKCFLRLESHVDAAAHVPTLDAVPRLIRLRASEEPLIGETPAYVEGIMRPQGEAGPTYYKVNFATPAVERRAALEAYFEASCGLKFDWRILLLADLDQARHLRTLLLECLPMARVEVTSDADQFLRMFVKSEPDLTILPPIAELTELVSEEIARHHETPRYMVVLLAERTAAATREAIRQRAHEILPSDCDLNDVRRALQRLQRPGREDGDGPLTHEAKDPTNAIRPAAEHAPAVTMMEEDLVRLMCLSSETHDAHSSFHLKRMSAYTAAISRELGWSEQRVTRLAIASKLHDIGKIGVPDSILHNTGALTEDERKVMQQHTRFGYHILHASASEVLRIGSVIALRHHERYDGKGYPDGISGDAIPTECQVVSVADVFDALTTQRVYKPAWTNAKAIDYIRQQAGLMFSPRVVDAFLHALPEIEKNQLRFMDDFRDIWTERRGGSRVPIEPVAFEMEIAMPEQTFRPFRLEAQIANISEGGMKCIVDGVTSDMYALLSSSRRYAKLRAKDAGWNAIDQVFCNVVWIDFYCVPDPTKCAMGMSFQKTNPEFTDWLQQSLGSALSLNA